jgi:hypothetical protein
MNRGGAQGAVVVVAVDDDGSAGDAVDWAAAEAAARGCSCGSCTRSVPTSPTDLYGVVPLTDIFVEARAAAEPALLNAVPDIAASKRRMHGSAGWTLPREAQDPRSARCGQSRSIRVAWSAGCTGLRPRRQAQSLPSGRRRASDDPRPDQWAPGGSPADLDAFSRHPGR